MSLPATWFDRMWDDDDPWALEAGWYEQRKRAVALAALPDPRYRRVFEPGCAGGLLSRELAPRCGELLCRDVAAPAVARARERLAPFPDAHAEHADVRDPWPGGAFDLVVVSEIAYYFDRPDRDALWAAAERALEPGGTLLAVHWRGAAPEHPVLGDPVHDELLARPALTSLAAHVEADFRLDVLVHTPGSPLSAAPPSVAPLSVAPLSVAQRSGLR